MIFMNFVAAKALSLITVAALSRVQVCCRMLAEIAGSIPVGYMNACLL